MHLKSGFLSILSIISSNVSNPAVAPNSETTPEELIDAATKAFSISFPNFINEAQKVEAKASPAPKVEVTGPSKHGQ